MDIKGYLLILLVAAILTACDATIHFYPVPDDPPEPNTGHYTGEPRLVVLELDLDRNPPRMYKRVTYIRGADNDVADLEEIDAERHDVTERYELRMIVEVSGGQFLERREKYLRYDAEPPQDTIHMWLPPGDYEALAWADYVERDIRADRHYLTSSLRRIDADLDNYPEDTKLRYAASGKRDFEIVEPGRAQDMIRIDLERCMGRFRIVATEADEFLDSIPRKTGWRAQVVYSQFISCAYSPVRQEPCDYIASYSFMTDVEMRAHEGELTIVGDHVFASLEREHIAKVDFRLLDPEGNAVSGAQGIEIPIRRNRETLVTGAFLSEEFTGMGGVAIDETFAGEDVITF